MSNVTQLQSWTVFNSIQIAYNHLMNFFASAN